MSLRDKYFEILGIVFCENLLKLSSHGYYVISYRKAVYNIFLMFLCAATFYLVSLHIFPQRAPNFVQGFSLWVLICIQLIPPMITLAVNLLASSLVANCANAILGIHRTVRSLGFKGEYKKTARCFGPMWVVTSAFLCTYLVVDTLIVLSYWHIPIFLAFIRNRILLFICFTFDAGNQLFRVKNLVLLKEYSCFINSLLVKENFLRVTRDLQEYRFKWAKKVFSSIDKISVRFNSKYSPYLLAHCFKLVVSAAPYFSDYFIIIFLPDYFSIYNIKGVNRSNAITILRLSYDIIYLLWIIQAHVKVVREVNNISVVIHDLVATGQVDDMAEELFDFSLEVLHTDLHFSAFGFFNIDLTLITMVVGNIISYTIILIQFQVSSNSLSNSKLYPNYTMNSRNLTFL